VIPPSMDSGYFRVGHAGGMLLACAPGPPLLCMPPGARPFLRALVGSWLFANKHERASAYGLKVSERGLKYKLYCLTIFVAPYSEARMRSLALGQGQPLRVLRNGGHAFGGRPQPADGVLLAAHDGVIPVDLPDFAYLYLLHLLAHPRALEHLRTARSAAGSTP
jgi:hypothetical protein